MPLVNASPPPVAAGLIRIDSITDLRGLYALRAQWSELLAQSSSDCIFLTWEWLSTWAKHFGQGRSLDVITVRHDGELIGLAPLAIGPLPGRLVPRRARHFLGAGAVGSDYLDVIARAGREADVVDALAPRLADEGSMVELAGVDRRSATAGLLARRLARRGWRVVEHASDPCPFIDLRGHTWASYLASLAPQHRYNVRRRLDRLTTEHGMRFERVESEERRREALAALIALHGERWRTRGGSTALDGEPLVAFHQDFTRLALQRGWLRLFVMHVDGGPGAALYGFRYRDRFCFYQTGFDPARSRLGVGQVTVGLSIKHAIDEGACEYDMLHGDERYKFDWAGQVRLLGRLEMYPPSARGWLDRRAVGLERAARRSARRLLPPSAADWMARRTHHAVR